MSEFIHTPDDEILIDGEEFTLEFFITQEPSYSLDKKYEGRIYKPGKQDTVHTSDEQFAGDGDKKTLIWDEGDLYISRVAQYVAARDVVVPPTDAEELEILRREVFNDASGEFQTRLEIEIKLYAALRRVNETIRTATLAELNALDITDDNLWK